MNSLKRIESKTIPRGSILIVESPDCVSRQRFFEAYSTYQRILSAGIEIHFLSIRDVLKPEHSFTNILRVGVEIDRANCESVLKSERVGKPGQRSGKRANGKTAMSARVPLWLKLLKVNTSKSSQSGRLSLKRSSNGQPKDWVNI